MEKNDYKKIFENYLTEGLPIFDSKGHQLQLQDDEEFRQCYDPSDPARRDFPKCWFVSNRGTLLSTHGKKVIWVRPVIHEADRNAYHFWINNKVKTVKAYNLAALVFGADRFGEAADKINKKGIYSFGSAEKPDNIMGHHILDIKSCPDLINDPANVQFVTSKVHNLIHQSGKNETEHDDVQYMQNLSKVAREEAPNEAVFVKTGDEYDQQTSKKISSDGEKSIATCKRFLLTERGLADFKAMTKALYYAMLDDALESLDE